MRCWTSRIFNAPSWYSYSFKWPHRKQLQGVKSREWADMSLLRPIHLFRNSLFSLWNSRLKCGESPSWKNHIFCFTSSYICGRLCRRKSSPISPMSRGGKRRTFNINLCLKWVLFVVYPFFSAKIWLLYKLCILFRVYVASAVHKINLFIN